MSSESVPAAPSSGRWNLFARLGSTSSGDKKAAAKKGSLGNNSSMYYHPELKRWVERGKEKEAAAEAAAEAEKAAPPKFSAAQIPAASGPSETRRALSSRYPKTPNLSVSSMEDVTSLASDSASGAPPKPPVASSFMPVGPSSASSSSLLGPPKFFIPTAPAASDEPNGSHAPGSPSTSQTASSAFAPFGAPRGTSSAFAPFGGGAPREAAPVAASRTASDNFQHFASSDSTDGAHGASPTGSATAATTSFPPQTAQPTSPPAPPSPAAPAAANIASDPASNAGANWFAQHALGSAFASAAGMNREESFTDLIVNSHAASASPPVVPSNNHQVTDAGMMDPEAAAAAASDGVYAPVPHDSAGAYHTDTGSAAADASSGQMTEAEQLAYFNSPEYQQWYWQQQQQQMAMDPSQMTPEQLQYQEQYNQYMQWYSQYGGGEQQQQDGAYAGAEMSAMVIGGGFDEGSAVQQQASSDVYPQHAAHGSEMHATSQGYSNQQYGSHPGAYSNLQYGQHSGSQNMYGSLQQYSQQYSAGSVGGPLDSGASASSAVDDVTWHGSRGGASDDIEGQGECGSSSRVSSPNALGGLGSPGAPPAVWDYQHPHTSMVPEHRRSVGAMADGPSRLNVNRYSVGGYTSQTFPSSTSTHSVPPTHPDPRAHSPLAPPSPSPTVVPPAVMQHVAPPPATGGWPPQGTFISSAAAVAHDAFHAPAPAAAPDMVLPDAVPLPVSQEPSRDEELRSDGGVAPEPSPYDFPDAGVDDSHDAAGYANGGGQHLASALAKRLPGRLGQAAAAAQSRGRELFGAALGALGGAKAGAGRVGDDPDLDDAFGVHEELDFESVMHPGVSGGKLDGPLPWELPEPLKHSDQFIAVCSNWHRNNPGVAYTPTLLMPSPPPSTSSDSALQLALAGSNNAARTALPAEASGGALAPHPPGTASTPPHKRSFTDMGARGSSPTVSSSAASPQHFSLTPSRRYALTSNCFGLPLSCTPAAGGEASRADSGSEAHMADVSQMDVGQAQADPFDRRGASQPLYIDGDDAPPPFSSSAANGHAGSQEGAAVPPLEASAVGHAAELESAAGAAPPRALWGGWDDVAGDSDEEGAAVAPQAQQARQEMDTGHHPTSATAGVPSAHSHNASGEWGEHMVDEAADEAAAAAAAATHAVDAHAAVPRPAGQDVCCGLQAPAAVASASAIASEGTADSAAGHGDDVSGNNGHHGDLSSEEDGALSAHAPPAGRHTQPSPIDGDEPGGHHDVAAVPASVSRRDAPSALLSQLRSCCDQWEATQQCPALPHELLQWLLQAAGSAQEYAPAASLDDAAQVCSPQSPAATTSGSGAGAADAIESAAHQVALQQECESLRLQLKAAQQDRQAEHDEAQQRHAAEVSSLQQQLDDLSRQSAAEAEALRAQCSAAQLDAAECTAALQAEASVQQDALEALRQEVHHTQAEQAASREALVQQVAAATADAAAARREAEELATRVAEMSAEVRFLTEEVSEKESAYNTLYEEHEELLLCLGQEADKIQALVERLEAAGIDAQPVLDEVEAKYIWMEGEGDAQDDGKGNESPEVAQDGEGHESPEAPHDALGSPQAEAEDEAQQEPAEQLAEGHSMEREAAAEVSGLAAHQAAPPSDDALPSSDEAMADVHSDAVGGDDEAASVARDGAESSAAAVGHGADVPAEVSAAKGGNGGVEEHVWAELMDGVSGTDSSALDWFGDNGNGV